jgi:Rab GDP dissociation inhibitor
MDGTEYDAIILGTGITESILSGLLSLEGKKILHIDKNAFYGDAGASLNITSLWKQFRPKEQPPKELGENRDWNVDLIPKFIMAYGKLVKMIIKTKVSEYLNWKCVEGIYVYQYSKGGFFSKEGGYIEKVPGNDKEALTSNLMSLLEKRRCQKFFQYAQQFDPKKPETFAKKNPFKVTFGEFIKLFGLEDNTIDFLGHAVALYTSDDFMNRPAVQVLEKLQTYIDSVGRFGESPFIYPVYGLAGIPESFSRKCAVYGGTFMLNVTIHGLDYDPKTQMTTLQGSFEDVKGIAKSKIVIGNPSYFV